MPKRNLTQVSDFPSGKENAAALRACWKSVSRIGGGVI
jgi:hypothetical protein